MSIRRLSSLFLTGLAVTALAACSLPGSHPRADSPSDTAAVKPHHPKPPAVSPTPSPSPTPSATPSPSTSPTPSPTPSTSPSASGPVFIDFKRAAVKLPISAATLPTAPNGLVQAIGIYLNHLWHSEYHGDPGCEQEVYASLGGTRSDGFAWVDIGYDPTLSTCADATGGGFYVIFAEPAGAWQRIFTGQDMPPCPLLERYDVPDDILAGRKATCVDPAAGTVVPYSHS